jgi:hypothetical protein
MSRSTEEALQTIRTVATQGPLPINNKQHVQQYIERDWFQRKDISPRPDQSSSRIDWSGASWSGERAAGRSWGGGR